MTANLLPVARQHRLTGFADARAVLLQACQHDLVAFLHVRAAKPRDVAGAGVMSLLLLRLSRGCDQNQRNDEKDLGHLICLHTQWTRSRRSIAFSVEVETGSHGTPRGGEGSGTGKAPASDRRKR